MGKKILSLCMALALCLGLLPLSALAAGEDAPDTLLVGGTNVKGGGYWTTNSTTGELTDSSEGNSWNVHYDTSTNTLTLKDADITGATIDEISNLSVGIYASGSSEDVSLNIILQGDNNQVSGVSGIYVFSDSGDASLSISGTGSLTAEGTGYGNYSGIMVQSNGGKAELTINNVDVTATNSNTQGIRLQPAVTSPATLAVNGGSLTASGSKGIDYQFGTSTTGSGTPTVTVSNNAIVRANGGIANNSSQIQYETGSNSTGGIVFDGNTGTVYGKVELQENLTIGEGESLTIPEGSSLTVPEDKTITVESGGKLEGEPTGSGTVKIAPTITTESLPDGEVGTAYSQTLVATGNDTITWSVSDTLPAGLSLSEDGKITGTPTTAGTSTFTVTAENSYGSDNKELSITISAPASVSVTGVSLNKDSLNLYVGGNETLTATITPDNATNKNVTWSSDTPSVASVNNGIVTAVAPGTATITVTTEDGNKTATCAVTVEKPYTPPPYIPPSKPNWTSVARKLANAQPGDTVTVKMNGETEVPGDVWETIAGRDVTVILDMGGNVSWTVDGNDVPTATHFADMDFGVDRNTTGIDVDVINAITGEVSSVQITLAHDGEFGFTLTLTAPLGRENAGSWANLYHYNEDAESLSYETSGEIQEDGTASLKMTHASQYAIIIDEQTHQLPFEDVPAGAWYETAVRYAYLHDIMEGMSATTFQPNGTLSRAMAVQIFYNLEGQPDISDENLGYPYEDVDAQAWYGNAVYWARITGVATGYGDGTFQPTDSITRQEFAQMLYNYAKYKGYDLTAGGDLSQFPDSGSVADWAEAAMSWANGNELINGHDDGTIDAAGIGTRAQAASILMRFDENVTE